MSEIIFIELAVILLVAFFASYIARAFKQPIIIGYIFAGIIISPFIFNLGASTEIISIFSQFGVAFLLFIVGLHMNPKIIKEVGVSSLLVGMVQIILTFGLGFLLAFKILGYSLITSSYIGIALAFSSTIIILKLLSDQRQLDSLYGKISIGILIVQDLVAIIVLMFISSSAEAASFSSFAFRGLLVGGSLILGLFLVGYLILPRVVKNVAKSQELLFLFSITWAFSIAALFSYMGFSIEIGKINKGEYQGTTTDIVVGIREYNGKVGIDIREFVTSEKYTGPTKKGLRIPAASFHEFKEMINSIKEEDLKADEVPEPAASTEAEKGQGTLDSEKEGSSEELPDY